MAASSPSDLDQRASEHRPGRRLLTFFLAATVMLVSACGPRSLYRAPVEDRGNGMSRPIAGAVDAGAKLLPGHENAGKPGYYSVKPGDTLIRIGLDPGQNWRDIGRWNSLENPNLIEVGQVLRVVAPQDSAQAVARPVSPGAATSTPIGESPTQAATAAKPTPAPTSSGGEEELAWIWPAQGSVLAGFDEAKNKGLDIGGKAGDSVLASAEGRVVYAGAGLRGYGNLIILKHNNTFLTAYAHNQALLVKEDQTVRKGQKIAEMGNSDADRVKLHFEIRRQGKPVDPAKYLPSK